MTYDDKLYWQFMGRIDQLNDSQRYQLVCMMAGSAAGGQPITEDWLNRELDRMQARTGAAAV